MKNNKYSDYKILHFGEKIKSFKTETVSAPIYVRVKPINLCNHGCFFCIYSDGFRVKDKDNHIISGMHTDIEYPASCVSDIRVVIFLPSRS